MASSATAGIGIAENEGSRAEAERVALERCIKSGAKANDCKIFITYDNECGALAREIGGGGGANASAMRTKDLAEKYAIKGCEEHTGSKCKITYSGCSLPVRVQ
jgi:hypothetical protein